jgi:hypothetical protein
MTAAREKRSPAPKKGGSSALLKRTAIALFPARMVEMKKADKVSVSSRLFVITNLPGFLLFSV